MSHVQHKGSSSGGVCTGLKLRLLSCAAVLCLAGYVLWALACRISAAPRPAGGMDLTEVWPAVQVYRTENMFHVPINRTHKQTQRSREQLMDQLRRRVPISTIRSGDGPFSGAQWEEHLPKHSLQDTLGTLGRCAVVMSSGSMRNSTLGDEIDAHDAVLRFNAAPTQEHSEDVGNKTTLRLVSSKLMTSKSARFLSDPLYNSGVLLAWDTAPYSKDLYEWYKEPDFNFFQTYWDYRKLHPQQPFYILNPSVQWNLWDIIQENSPVHIQPNPPSSGMLGIAVMMNLCRRISVYGFLPSRRTTDRCHYYEGLVSRQCSVGRFHPLLFEKSLVRQLQHSTEAESYSGGRVTLHGVSSAHAPLAPPLLCVCTLLLCLLDK